ncbi:ribonuclease HI [bacterium]|nr:ribonuclease HI [bacterium]
MAEVHLYTDGACSGNPGPGGWACVLVANQQVRVLSGFDPATTNNRMELMGVIQGLDALKRPTQVHITTDSTYVKNAFTEGWLEGWQRNGWKTSSKEPVKNQDLWLKLCHLQRMHVLTWEWVKGHSGHSFNEICDSYARTAIQEKSGRDERSTLAELLK